MNTKTKQHESIPNGANGEEPKGAKVGEPESSLDGSTPSIKQIRSWDLGFLPIPKSRRHDPNMKPHEQFIFTWKINLVLAGAAVSSDGVTLMVDGFYLNSLLLSSKSTIFLSKLISSPCS